jgi:DNA-binding GntR family transcriptional regulator
MIMWTKYEKIARDLRDGIAKGEHPPGSALPPIPELMAKYDVARETVRNAIAALANEGLVTPQPGIGTIVRDTGVVNLHSRPAEPHPVWDSTAGADAKTVTVEAAWITADHEIAALLSVELASDVVRRLRHYYKGRDVVLIHEQWITGSVAKAIQTATSYDAASRTDEQPADLYTLMRQAGQSPIETTEVVTTRMPDPAEKEAMNMPAGVPVLVTLRVTRGPENTPLETSSFIACGDRASQTYTVPISS